MSQSAFPEFTKQRVYRDDEDRTGHDEYLPTGGMSLRDYIATHALQGVLANSGDDFHGAVSDLAKVAYRYADAMLKAREGE